MRGGVLQAMFGGAIMNMAVHRVGAVDMDVTVCPSHDKLPLLDTLRKLVARVKIVAPGQGYRFGVVYGQV
ncbi:hypothetical protein HYQ46_008262 [Verticillium longisporum]|nr:hypothetical protein HYQ46_008262 [Verticillium longisporum]